MLDLDGPDVRPSTRQNAGKWAMQPAIREGYLPVWDAACLMSERGYGGITDELSRSTIAEIAGLCEAITRSIDFKDRLEGYPAEERYVNEGRVDTYPLIAYRNWVRRTGIGDGRYFEDRILKEGKELPAPEHGPDENPYKYQGEYQLDPNSPRARSGWEHRDTLSVKEFVYLYCGIDENKVSEDWYLANAEVQPYIESLRRVISENLIAEPSAPACTDVDNEVPF